MKGEFFYEFKSALLPKISLCKYALGISPTIIDSPIKMSVRTAKFSVRDGITIEISATTFKYIECLVWLMPTLSNSEENPQVTLLTGIMRKWILGPSPANASMPVSAPKGMGMPFKLKFFKLDCETEAVSRAILLIFNGSVDIPTILSSLSRVTVTRSS